MIPSVPEIHKINGIYQTILEKVLRHPLPVPQEVSSLLSDSSAVEKRKEHQEKACQWLGLLNLAVTPHLLRTYILTSKPDESELKSLVRFLVAKPSHNQGDRDKVDWLATHVFKSREEKSNLPTAWPKADLLEILSGFDYPGLSRQAEDLLMEMPALLDEVKYFSTFSQITDSRIIQRARDLKNQFGEEFFHPDVLTAIVNYNLIFGNKFHGLVQDSIRQVQEFAKSDPNTVAPDAKRLLSTDYRLTGEAFNSIGNLSRREAAGQSSQEDGGEQKTTAEQQLKELGVDADQEALYLKSRIEELLMRLRGNPNLTSVPNSFAPLMLEEWEINGMRNPYPDSEQSFRADFSRGVTRTIAIIYRIYEEIPQFLEKKGTEFLWKRHYDSLVYLLYEGRNQKDALLQLSNSAGSRGLSEKARQLQQTTAKLESALAKVAELF
jgi:hypothetical protein